MPILIIEAVAVYVFVLWAHSLRRRFGLTPFFLLLGILTAVMSVVTDAGIVVQFAGITFMVGSTVFYTSLLLGIFVVYAFDGPRATRIAIATVVGVSILVPAIAWLLHIQADLFGGSVATSPALPDLRINTASVVATIIDLFFLAVAWEYLGKSHLNLKLRSRSFLTLLGVMWLDVLLFATGAFAGTPAYGSIMKGTLISRLFISVFAFPFLYVYLRWQSKRSDVFIENRPVLAIIKKVAEENFGHSLSPERAVKRRRSPEAKK